MLLLQTSRFGASWVLCGSFCQHPTCSYSAMLLGWEPRPSPALWGWKDGGRGAAGSWVALPASGQVLAALRSPLQPVK